VKVPVNQCGRPNKQAYQVVFSLKVTALVSMRIEAQNDYEAAQKAREVLGEGSMRIPMTEGADNILTGLNLEDCSLVASRPCPKNPFDLTGLDLKSKLQACVEGKPL
jgi:hypothetical protein